MGISIDKRWNQQLIFFTILLMLFSLFISRALLSIGFGLFLIITCCHKKIGEQLNLFSKNPFLVGMSLLFLIPFFSRLWSHDQQMWLRFIRIKLPLFLFPVAFAGEWKLSAKQWRWSAFIFLLLIFSGCCWSLWQYAQNASVIDKQYLQAKIFSTPLDNDHVRFSLLVCVAIITCVLLIKQTVQRRIKYILIIACIFFIAYLHILSARTGLISFYIFVFLSIAYFLFSLRKFRWSIISAVVLLAVPVAAWFLFPTFQNRIRYNLYDLSNVNRNNYVKGANDGNRILSLQAGWHILKAHPLGVGTDIPDSTFQWYDANTSYNIPEKEKLFPSSEVLMYAGFAGWLGAALFLAAMALPFFQRTNDYFFWIVLNVIMLFSFLFDIGLEAQFGVFIYAFIVLWWWKWFRFSKQIHE